jgi:hypothetical protein
MNVRKVTYGIYLSHTVLLATICCVAKRTLGSFFLLSNLQTNIGKLTIVTIFFGMMYSLATITTIFFLK